MSAPKQSEPCPYCGRTFERSKQAAANWNLANHLMVCLKRPKDSA